MKATTSTTTEAILGLLTLRPMSGYDIRQNIAEFTAHFWSESFGQIYPTLTKLNKQGLVRRESDTGHARKRNVYGLTRKGEKQAAAWLASPAAGEAPRNELLLKVFLGAQLTPEANAAQIVQYRDKQTEMLKLYAELDKRLGKEHAGEPQLPYCRMTLRHVRGQCEAAVRWCDETIIELYEMQQSARRAKAREAVKMNPPELPKRKPLLERKRRKRRARSIFR